ncbi:hypothetical protein DVH05_000901 [Phytophthora capsici]|nr:hypothetical protein DVH05_000901 [Phytophthora capsici]
MGIGQDDVEMEFISVMGVLVPMEVTKGVSEEALRFATGSISSASDTEPCNNDCQDQSLNSSILDNDNVKGKMEVNVDGSDAKKELPDRNESEENLHLEPVKPKSSNKRESMEISSPVNSVGKMQKPVRERRKRAKVTKTQVVEMKPKKKIYKSNDKLENSRKLKKKIPKIRVGTSRVCSQTVQSCKDNIENTKPIGRLVVSPTVKEDKRLRPFNDEVTTGKKITKTWLLESDGEEQGKKQRKKKKPSSLHSSTTARAASVTMKANSRSSSGDNGVCMYPDCTQPSRYRYRCAEHNSRRRCSVLGCTKFAHSGGNCIAHGGGSRCMEDGCDRRSRSQGKCYAHGGGMRCSHPNCTTRAKSKGKCVAHGGGTFCSERECAKLAISNGRCISHGGYIHCSLPECDKRAQVRGKCVEHSETDITSKAENCEQPIGSTTELDEMTMKLRSGQRIKLAPSWRNKQKALQSEEEALEMVLKLSAIEY